MNFGKIENAEDVAASFGASTSFLQHFTQAPWQNFYREMHLLKRGRRSRRQTRRVFKATNRVLRIVQKNLSIHLSTVEISSAAHGCVLGRSPFTNAMVHLGKKKVLKADLKGFFHAISQQRIKIVLSEVGVGSEAAELLSRLTTIEGSLAPGLACSPVLANLVCRQLDAEFLTLAAQHSCVYTRYVDDITFSGDTVPPKSELQACVTRHGFELVEEKYRTQRRGRSQFVTGLCVADSNQPRIPKRTKRRIRLEVHYCSLNGIDGHFNELPELARQRQVARITGMLAFMLGIERDYTSRLLERWIRAVEQSPYELYWPDAHARA